MIAKLLVFLSLVTLINAFLRVKRHYPSQSLQHYFRDKALAQQTSSRNNYNYYNYAYAQQTSQRQSYYYPQQSYYYPSYYYPSSSYYYRQPDYYSTYYSQYYSQYPQYQHYARYPYYQQYSSPYGSYGSYYQYNQPNYYSGYYSQQSSSGGLQMDKWGNRYVMLGNFKLHVTCKSRGCPG